MLGPLRVQIDRARRRIGERLDQAWALSRRRLGPASPEPPFDGDARFAIVTVNYSTTRLLALMLLTLGEQRALDRVRRVVIVDNASRDGGPPMLRTLAARARRIALVENRVWLSHARGMRRGLRALDALDAEQPASDRANVLLFVDTDVIFRDPAALEVLARTIEGGAAAAGELRRGLHPYPEAQASFLAVRRDAYARPDVAPWVDHGAPAYWLQESLWRAGLEIADFPSNHGGFVLHRGRAGVAAAHAFRPASAYASVGDRAPHFMGVPDGARIWAETEARWAALLAPDAREALIERLASRFT